MDYAKLTTDVREALERGRESAALVSDGGACNLDGVLLRLPRKPEKAVVAALRDAGIYARKSNWGYFGTGYMINPHDGQADKRYTACLTIADHLHKAGYDVSNFYMID